MSASSAKLPEGVSEVQGKTFKPPTGQRGEGQPSPKLRRHLGIGGSTRRACRTDKKKTSLESIMRNLFLFFFTIEILTKITEFTNAKTTEMIWKYRERSADGKFCVKVRVMSCTMRD